jgi:hypothetical protein
MTKQTLFILLMESFILYWWACLFYARQKAVAAHEAEKAKYSAWDNAYNTALRAEKTHYQATLEAVRAIGGGQPLLTLWNEAYKKALADGVREYRAKTLASDAVRKAAHG